MNFQGLELYPSVLINFFHFAVNIILFPNPLSISGSPCNTCTFPWEFDNAKNLHVSVYEHRL